jgi:hypothetical protein
MEKVCEGAILCKVETFEVWIVVELGGVAKVDHIEANIKK